ncbi:MAG TPA: cytochrome b/b6 domain-containing protein [archaeon]|nr:cytochrome b/b6 domain-containing protein [archaeon]
MPRIYLYTLYERIWHWLQATVIIILILTGMSIHFPDKLQIIGFVTAVRIHNTLAFILIANAFLALIYHLATGLFKQFIPERRNFLSMVIQQTAYYMGGIFKGDPHPFKRDQEHKLNPLQKITYLGILNILLPLQVASGFLMWGAQYWPEITNDFVPLVILGKIHTIGAWLFMAFVCGHVYLTTTGPTPLSYIKAMLTGWEEAEENPETRESTP